jgi:8-oxo-dGTP diphosphatase
MSGIDQIANVDVFLILRDATGRLLLGLRAPHLYAGGQWNVVSGKADAGEDVASAVLREAREEAGLVLELADLHPAGVLHYFPADGKIRVGFGFGVRHDPDRHGAVINHEPDKCDALGWFRRDELPQPLEPYTAAMLYASETSFAFTVAGWPTRPGSWPPPAHQHAPHPV